MEKEIERLKRTLELVKKSGDQRAEGVILTSIGQAYKNWGKYPEAIDYYKQSLEITQKLGDLQGEGVNLNNIGVVYKNLGKYHEALEYYLKSLNIRKKLKDRKGEGVTLSNIGSIYIALKQYSEAQEYYEKGLNIAQELRNKHLEGNAYSSIGSIHESLGNYQEALNYYQKGLLIAQELGNRRGEIKALTGLGNVQYSLGEYAKSIEYYKESLTFTQEIYDRRGEGQCYNRIGNVYFSWQRFSEAIEYYLDCLEITQELGNRDGEGNVLSSIGNVFYSWREHEKALHYYEKSLAIAQEVENRYLEGITLNNIGLVKNRLKKHSEAIDYFQKSLHIRKEIGDKRGEGTVLSNIGSNYDDLKKYPEALKYYKESLTIAQELGDRRGEEITLTNIGLVLKAQGKIEKAIKYFQDAIAIQDILALSGHSSEIRRSARKSMMYTLAAFIPCLVATKQNKLALAYVEHNKGREMILEGQDRAKKLNPELAKLNDQLVILDEKLQKANSTYSKLTELKEKEELTIKEYETRFQRLRSSERKILEKRKKIQQQIWEEFPIQGTALPREPEELITRFLREMPDEWLILDYFIDTFEKKFIIFVIQNNSIKTYHHPFTTEQKKFLTDSAKHIIDSRRKAVNLSKIKELEKQLSAFGQQLYSFLLPIPLQNFIKKTSFKHITIIPTSFLHSLPLELIEEKKEYWGKKYAFSRAFNLQTLRAALIAQQEKADLSLIAVGDPTANIDNLGLKFARQEVEEINRLCEQKNVTNKLLLQHQASESAFLKALNDYPYTLIHFAGHAIFNLDNPELSHLLMREGDQPIELYGNELPKKVTLTGHPLVILSACETGGMYTELGDEVLGLARGFVEAGARGLALSGWEVFDDSARAFYLSFYTQYLEGSSCAEALRLSRIAVSDQAKQNKFGAKSVDLVHWGSFRYYGLPF